MEMRQKMVLRFLNKQDMKLLDQIQNSKFWQYPKSNRLKIKRQRSNNFLTPSIILMLGLKTLLEMTHKKKT